MFKLYKLIFISGIDERKYVVYCNKSNLPTAIEKIVNEYAGDLISFIPCVFKIKTLKKCKNLLTIETRCSIL